MGVSRDEVGAGFHSVGSYPSVVDGNGAALGPKGSGDLSVSLRRAQAHFGKGDAGAFKELSEALEETVKAEQDLPLLKKFSGMLVEFFQ